MIWSKKQNKRVTLIELTSLLLAEIVELREELRMDFTTFNAAMAKVATDVSAEIAAAVAAITAAQSDPADQSNLDNAVTALGNIDAIVNAATAQFTPAGTSTSTSTVPPPPVV